MNRAERRALARQRTRKPARRAHDDSRMTLRCQGWKIDAVWAPMQQLLADIELRGEVHVAQGRAVFYSHQDCQWIEAAPALQGLIEFHELASARNGHPLNLNPLRKFAAKLEHGVPIFAGDIDSVRACEQQCRRQAGALTVTEATDIVRTVQTRVALEARGMA